MDKIRRGAGQLGRDVTYINYLKHSEDATLYQDIRSTSLLLNNIRTTVYFKQIRTCSVLGLKIIFGPKSYLENPLDTRESKCKEKDRNSPSNMENICKYHALGWQGKN